MGESAAAADYRHRNTECHSLTDNGSCHFPSERLAIETAFSGIYPVGMQRLDLIPEKSFRPRQQTRVIQERQREPAP